MTLQQLEYLLALSRTRHFGRAAEECDVTQPTLSAMISKLEDELEAKLFDRKQTPLGITPIGEAVVAQAKWFYASQRNYSAPSASRKALSQAPFI